MPVVDVEEEVVVVGRRSSVAPSWLVVRLWRACHNPTQNTRPHWVRIPKKDVVGSEAGT